MKFLNDFSIPLLKLIHFYINVFQIPLPVPVQSLMDMDQVFSLPIPSGAFKTPSYTYGIQEAYNQLKSAGSIKELIPPFKGMHKTAQILLQTVSGGIPGLHSNPEVPI
jgi:hypothetical protein